MMEELYFEKPAEYRKCQSNLDGQVWLECDGMYMLVDADWATRCKDEDGDRR